MTGKYSTIHIAFAINDAYADHLGVEIVSILSNNKKSVFSFYVLSNDISRTSKNKLELTVGCFSRSTINFIHMDDSLFDGFPLRIKHITKEAYYRYVLPDVLPSLSRVLYLDADLLVLGDITPLWSIDLEGYFVAGSHKEYITKQFPGYKESIGLQESDTYVNSGVLLLNLDYIRKRDKVRELFDNTVKLKDIIRIQDQDVINITFRDEIRHLDKIYNYTTSDMAEWTRKPDEVIVVHFNTKNKPWNSNFAVTDDNRFFANAYLAYLNKYRTLTASSV